VLSNVEALLNAVESPSTPLSSTSSSSSPSTKIDIVVDLIDSVGDKTAMLMECRRRLAGVRGGKKGPTRVRVCDIARCTNGKLVKQAMPVLLFALPLFTNVLAAAAFSPTPLQAPEAATAKARVPE